MWGVLSSFVPFDLFCSFSFVCAWAVCDCPPFGWDRVNFHRELGGAQLGWLIQTSQRGYFITCDVVLAV